MHNNISIYYTVCRMEEESSIYSFFFWLCSRIVGAACFLGSVLCLFIVYCKAAWERILALASSLGFF